QVVSASDITAGNLRFVPDADENGSPYTTVGFHVSDGTAFSVAENTLTLNVTAVNDPPTSTDDSVTTAEDTTVVLSLSDFGTYSDATDGADATALAAVKITTLESNGSLEYNNCTTWVAVTLNQVVSASDITAGHLRVVPDCGRHGSPYTTVGF